MCIQRCIPSNSLHHFIKLLDLYSHLRVPHFIFFVKFCLKEKKNYLELLEMVLDIELFRKEKGGDPDKIRENAKKRFDDVNAVEEVIKLGNLELLIIFCFIYYFLKNFKLKI